MIQIISHLDSFNFIKYNNKDTAFKSGWASMSIINCLCVFVCVLTADRGRSPLDSYPLLTALVGVSGDGRAQALAVTPAVTVARICQAVSIEPGHIHLITHTNNTYTHGNRPYLGGRGWGWRGVFLFGG